MAGRQGRPCYFFDISEMRGKSPRISIEQAEGTLVWAARDLPEYPDYPPKGASREERIKYNEEYENHDLANRPMERHDPLLIQVIEELGAAANGKSAELKIVEIPDHVEYEIHDYDGMESVEEKHRSWS